MAELEFRVLGPVQAWRAGQPVPLGGNRVLTLLAGLLLSPNEVVSWHRLAEWVWGDQPPSHPRSALHNGISRVRQLLGRSVIQTQGSGYQLVTDAAHHDLLLFDQLTTAAADAELRGATEAAVDLLSEALALWRPPLLGNLDASALYRHTIDHLTDRYLDAHEERARLCLRLGRHAELIVELSDLVRANPFRETLAGQLMLALFRSGRRADALMVYQQLRQVLRDELGVDPGTTIRDLHSEILRTESAVPAREPGPPMPVHCTSGSTPVAQVPPRQLPAPSGRLIGRDPQLAALDDWLAAGDSTLAAVVGPAGAGKTALALWWANRIRGRFPDGQLYLDLGGYGDAPPLRVEDSLAILLGALGVPTDAVPTEIRSAGALLRSMLAERQVLVVLDNARDSDQIRPLLPGGGSTAATVVTSRKQLRGLVARDGAHRVEVAELEADAAAELLCAAAGLSPGSLTPQVTTDLVQRCAGLPLALRIIGERIARTGVAMPGEPTTVSGLDVLSTHEGTDTDLAAVLDWSYRALDAKTAAAYRQLGRYPGTELRVEDAPAVFGGSADVASRMLDTLAAMYLVQQRGAGRYEWNDLIRRHAARCADLA
ncbi:BTAD domain-containing putative transcriptional regulator [Actinocatenispora sera]|uniref:OmpR/PhoB-type domain-containing protein n=1 Tax=Actinocatenispora sera TaxID=390989 RepID=A0A810L187_9ACTN|nr:BTAD domain-containing putative transcriptional regulator [Actinocatenispora sera]BCJ29290.1 hypothetical protein Asera_33980 [Actinocatenispora sera]